MEPKTFDEQAPDEQEPMEQDSPEYVDTPGNFKDFKIPEGTPLSVVRVLDVLQQDVFAPMRRRTLYDTDRLALARKLAAAANVNLPGEVQGKLPYGAVPNSGDGGLNQD